MLRKTVLSLVAGLGVMFGSSALSPADARIYISIGNVYGFHHHHCGWRQVYVKVWSQKKHHWVRRWVNKRVCW
jgi:hypothetical protein